MKNWLSLAAALLALAGVSRAEWQAGAAGTLLLDEETAFGLTAEIGGHYQTGTIDSFFGLEALLAGTDSETENTTTDTSYFALMAMYRGYYPLDSAGRLRVYGQAGLGVGNCSVDYTSRQGNIEEDGLGFGFQLGLGLEYGLSENFSVRGGYDLWRVPEQSGDWGDLGGILNGFSLGVVLRF